MEDETPKKRRPGRPALTPEEKERRKLELRKKREAAIQNYRVQNPDTPPRQAQLVERAISEETVLSEASQAKHRPTTSEEGNKKYLHHSIQLAELPPVKWEDPECLHKRVLDYLKLCETNGMRPTVAGLALAFGVSRGHFLDIRNGRRRANLPQACRDALEQGVTIINAQMEDYMMNKKIDPVSGIFIMKNNMGYRDQQDYVITPANNGEATPEKLIAEANALPDDDIDDIN